MGVDKLKELKVLEICHEVESGEQESLSFNKAFELLL